jgi:hypothetical protein
VDFSAAANDYFGIFFTNLDIVDDAGLGHPQAGNAGDMGFIFLQFGRAQAAQPFQPIGQPFFFQRVQSGKLVLAGGHHQFAASLVGNPMFPAEAVQGLAPGHAVLGLQGTRLVI